MAHSSSGLGRVPLKDEITGSNPVCATKHLFYHLFKAIYGLYDELFSEKGVKLALIS